ncbi:MAG: phosphatidylglycerophosphatase A [Pyrinomonadaceae bacterium]|nr:phosphatidylglycerophosphatase A [Pyrinomonadaceae bacterium]
MKQKRNLSDLIALAVSTSGVGYLPLAPGTWGSILAIGIYLAYRYLADGARLFFLDQGWSHQQYSALIYTATAVLLVAFCLFGIWASKKTAALLEHKDPQIIVVDEIMGQLIVFAFVPFGISRWLVVAGFLLFRVFDIWKPYPIKAVEKLPNGIGVCADDIIAGIYGGICLSIIYVISLGF